MTAEVGSYGWGCPPTRERAAVAAEVVLPTQEVDTSELPRVTPGEIATAAAETAQELGVDGLLERARDAVERAYRGSPSSPPAVIDLRDNSIGPGQSPVYKKTVGRHVREAAESKEQEPKFTVRYAKPEDIPILVEVDMRCFSKVYEAYGKEEDDLREDLLKKFRGRYEKVGPKWMPVLERDGVIVGFMTSCPTSKRPEEFRSWEDTTDNGTLETTYDPKGKNVYVVTLSVLPEGSEGKDMLYANQIGRAIRKGYELSFFESRMPGLGGWVRKQARQEGWQLDTLAPEQLDNLAEAYFNKKTTVDDVEVPYDRLLRLYDRIGCKLLKPVRNAYKDEPSMNYGVVCVLDLMNPLSDVKLPIDIPNNRFTRWIIGSCMQLISQSQKRTQKYLFKEGT